MVNGLKLRKCFSVLLLSLLANFALAGTSTVNGAKITAEEFYGNQFTHRLDKAHNSGNCGHPGQNVVAVNLRVTDDVCSGDRPTLLNWSAQ